MKVKICLIASLGLGCSCTNRCTYGLFYPLSFYKLYVMMSVRFETPRLFTWPIKVILITSWKN